MSEVKRGEGRRDDEMSQEIDGRGAGKEQMTMKNDLQESCV